MTKDEAIEVLLKHGDFTRDRPGTGYGGPNIFECKCCERPLNVKPGTHAPDCKLKEALVTLGSKREY